MVQNNNKVIGIDLGVNNFVTIQNNIGLKPIVINGKGLKSINQYYNKNLSYLLGISIKINGKYFTNKMQKLTNKRDNKIDYFMHNSSRFIINYCILNNIDTIVIGYNKKWKQDINIGISTQTFVQIPYLKFVNQIKYKAEDVGIKVITIEESYTSKASFIDNDEMEKDFEFSGKRIKRGLYKTNDGLLINSDVNGASNIIRKVFPNAFADGIEGVCLHPYIINVI